MSRTFTIGDRVRLVGDTFTIGDRVRLVGDTFTRVREVAALGREHVPAKPLATVLEVGEWKVLVRFDDSASVYPIPPRRLVRA